MPIELRPPLARSEQTSTLTSSVAEATRKKLLVVVMVFWGLALYDKVRRLGTTFVDPLSR